MKYTLNVIQPIMREGQPLPQFVEGRAHSVMHTLVLEVDQSLDWVKAHAGEIANRAVPGGHSALWVAQA